jgi:phosphatidylglycerophosphatase A
MVFRNPIHFLAFGFGAGLSPKAPGTMGTIVAIPIYLLLTNFELTAYLSIVAVMAVLGIGICGYSAKVLGVPDHPAIVWDEIVGYLITMTALPSSGLWTVVGFLLFRLLDIWKPWPISWCDRHIHGGFGIMLDDVLAGAVACGIVHGILVIWAG